jgi:hypothetical protein
MPHTLHGNDGDQVEEDADGDCFGRRHGKEVERGKEESGVHTTLFRTVSG